MDKTNARDMLKWVITELDMEDIDCVGEIKHISTSVSSVRIGLDSGETYVLMVVRE